jgi:hypothetical protein
MISTGRSVRFVGPIYLRSSLGGTFDVSQRRLIRSCKVLVFKSYVPALLRATGKRYCGVCWRAAPHRHAQWCVQAAVSGAVPIPPRHPDAGRIFPAGRRTVRRDAASRTTNAGRATKERRICPEGVGTPNYGRNESERDPSFVRMTGRGDGRARVYSQPLLVLQLPIPTGSSLAPSFEFPLLCCVAFGPRSQGGHAIDERSIRLDNPARREVTNRVRRGFSLYAARVDRSRSVDGSPSPTRIPAQSSASR